jgi:predicted dehydrogenase
MASRREFINRGTKAAAGVYLGTLGFSAKSYARILGANDRVRVGAVGFSDRFRHSLLPSFLHHNKELNFDIVAVSDIWKVRREEGKDYLKQTFNHDISAYPNNEALYSSKGIDAVIISTADFQHALHTIEAIKGGCDAYTEKPFAETMDDNIAALKAVKASDRIVQIGSQRRSGPNYIAAANFIQQGRFGPITMVELTGFSSRHPSGGCRLEALPDEPPLRTMGSTEIPGVPVVLALFLRHARTVDVAPD